MSVLFTITRAGVPCRYYSRVPCWYYSLSQGWVCRLGIIHHHKGGCAVSVLFTPVGSAMAVLFTTARVHCVGIININN